MILKKTWKDLIQNKQDRLRTMFGNGSETWQLLTDIDDLVGELSLEGGTYCLLGILDTVYNDFLKTSTTNIWNDLPIYASSYRFEDVRPLLKIYGKLKEYAGFYKKILTDEGFSKRLTIHREYTNSSDADSENKGYNSETPQIELENFEEGIKYASSLDKGTSEQHTDNEGESTITTTSKTFEEDIKNTKMIYFNDLIEYVEKIPEMIYHEYCLESYPAPHIIKETIEAIINSYEQERN